MNILVYYVPFVVISYYYISFIFVIIYTIIHRNTFYLVTLPLRQDLVINFLRNKIICCCDADECLPHRSYYRH